MANTVHCHVAHGLPRDQHPARPAWPFVVAGWPLTLGHNSVAVVADSNQQDLHDGPGVRYGLVQQQALPGAAEYRWSQLVALLLAQASVANKARPSPAIERLLFTFPRT